MTDTTVKYLHSGLAGAPVLSGTAGSLIAVLDACLVNGFGVAAVSSLVVAGNVATATVSGGSGAEVGSVVTIAGAVPAGLNGEQKVLSVGGGGTTLTFATSGISDQTATGSISVKLAGAGWGKTYSGTNLAAYKSNHVAGTGCLLRVDDTAAKVARCVGYESMTDINSGSGPFPTAVQRSGGTYWTKSSASDSGARPWVLVGDDRFFYFLPLYSPGYSGGAMMAFGDLLPAGAGDVWACVLSGYSADRSGSGPGTDGDYAHLHPSANDLYLARSYAALGGSTAAFKTFPLIHPNHSNSVASGSGPMQYPNGADMGLYLVPHLVCEVFFNCLRGTSPGLYCCPQNLPLNLFANGQRIASVDNLLGREVRTLLFGANNSVSGVAFFDTTGPWR